MVPAFLLQPIGGGDELVSRGDHVPAPAAKERRGEKAHERAFHEDRVHEKGVTHEELVPQNAEVHCPEPHEEARIPRSTAGVHTGEERFAAHNEVHHRCHHGQEDAIEEGCEGDDGDALASFDAFARENKDGEEESTTDDARG